MLSFLVRTSSGGVLELAGTGSSFLWMVISVPSISKVRRDVVGRRDTPVHSMNIESQVFVFNSHILLDLLSD